MPSGVRRCLGRSSRENVKEVYYNQHMAVDCKQYCLFVSAAGAVFMVPSNLLTQLYLAFLVSFNSKTLYVIPNNRLATAVALFFSSFVPIVSSPQIYAGIFAYLYYDRYINISRREGVQRWLEERRERAQQTMQSQEMQVLNELSRRSVVTYK